MGQHRLDKGGEGGENVFEPLVPAAGRSATPSFSGFTKQQLRGKRGKSSSREGRCADGRDGREDGGGGRVVPLSLSSSLPRLCGILNLLPASPESGYCGARCSPAGETNSFESMKSYKQYQFSIV